MNFRNQRPSGPQQNDAIIAVMGMTGAGKSTFIRNFCNTAIIGEGLRSMTVSMEMHRAQTPIDGRQLFFIDTPGFDDTQRSDTEVLREIVDWLSASYQRKTKLTGIVYLHGIQNPRVGGNAQTNIRLFGKLCGNNSLSSVVFATTHWSPIADERIKQENRHRELIDDEDFWAAMIARGASPFKHDGGNHTALKIVRHILAKRPVEGLTLRIQEEMAQGLSLESTGAGMELENKLRSVLGSHMREIEQLKEELGKAQLDNDERTRKEVEKAKGDLEKKIERERLNRERLKVDFEQLRRERKEELRKEEERIKKEHAREIQQIQQQYHDHETAMKVKLDEQKKKLKRYRATIKQQEGCVIL